MIATRMRGAVIDLAPDAMYDEIRAHGVWVLG